MKLAASVLAAMFMISGCASTATPPPASNLQTVRSLYESFGRGDVPAVLGTLDANLVWNEAEGNPYADRNPYRGPQGVAEGLFMRLGSEWNGYTVTPERFLDAGDSVVVLGRYRGTYKQTQKPLDAQFAHVWTLREGKIVEFQQYADTEQFVRVMRR